MRPSVFRYFKYVHLCSFAHGSQQGNLLRVMHDVRSPYRGFATATQIRERFEFDVQAESFTLSFLSVAQATAELATLYPGDVEITVAAANAWKTLAEASLLTKAIWEIRTRQLLGAIS